MKALRLTSITFAALAAAVTGCMTTGVTRPDVPAAVSVPAGHVPTMSLKGTGLLTYECRAKAGDASAHEWVFAAPDAVLEDGRGMRVGRYYGGPTWEHKDGGKVTGKQLAVSPAGAGSIPLQLVEASGGTGAFNGVTYIQRVNTMGGVAPTMRCDGSTAGTRQTVNYSADYIFYKRG